MQKRLKLTVSLVLVLFMLAGNSATSYGSEKLLFFAIGTLGDMGYS